MGEEIFNKFNVRVRRLRPCKKNKSLRKQHAGSEPSETNLRRSSGLSLFAFVKLVLVFQSRRHA